MSPLVQIVFIYNIILLPFNLRNQRQTVLFLFSYKIVTKPIDSVRE